jgi:hypothetical protein
MNKLILIYSLCPEKSIVLALKQCLAKSVVGRGGACLCRSCTYPTTTQIASVLLCLTTHHLPTQPAGVKVE